MKMFINVDKIGKRLSVGQIGNRNKDFTCMMNKFWKLQYSHVKAV